MKLEHTGHGLQKLLEALADPTPLLQTVGGILRDSTVNRIVNTKTSPDGEAWAPWAMSTMLARTKRGTSGTGLLYETGGLANSITFEIQGNSVIVGSNSPVAPYLQNGTDNMPARPFVGISQEDSDSIHSALADFLAKATK